MMEDAVETKNLNMILHCEEQAKTFEMEWEQSLWDRGMETKTKLLHIHELAEAALDAKSIPPAIKAMEAAEAYEY